MRGAMGRINMRMSESIELSRVNSTLETLNEKAEVANGIAERIASALESIADEMHKANDDG
jgi:hypothetical protein